MDSMEEDRGLKHMCKFCCKRFPSGRSLGGHMRSHLINISSDENLIKKKKLPPLPNYSGIVDELRENPKKTNKSSNDDDSLLKDKICKECGKGFQSWKALFGHMKCHSVISSVEEGSWNGSNDHFLDSESDNEFGLNLCRRKRSDRMIKRYNTSSSLSTIAAAAAAAAANVSPCISEIDQQEQEEVAISLIMLSRDVSAMNSVLDQSSENNSNFLEPNKISLLNTKKSKSDHEQTFGIINGLKISKSHVSAYGFLDNESEVNSPKKLINKSGSEKFETDSKKKRLSKRKCIDSHDTHELSVPQDFQEKVAYFGTSDYEFFKKKRKFECTHCHKAFSSYQALGGHRASHKKFKACCTPNSENRLDILPNQTAKGHLMVDIFPMKSESEVGFKNIHKCPICFKVFASGQALGGHKRSHLIREEKTNPSTVSVLGKKVIPAGIRDFLDLNLPAPVEEDLSNDQLGLKPWWKGTSSLEHELLLRLHSS